VTDDIQRYSQQLSQPRVAEMVADILRTRIVEAELADGALLPKQDDLLKEFPVSRPSIREAMRILETEGLVSVRRGNIGGAEVHAPKAETAAHMLGLVLQSRRVSLADLAGALRILEPACAGLCAARKDRQRTVVPRLETLNEEARGHLEDAQKFTDAILSFHDEMVAMCGNATMALLVGTLETLWSYHASRWAVMISKADREYPKARLRKLREAALAAQVEITDAIASGDSEAARLATERHIDKGKSYLLASNGDQRVNITGLRSRMIW
jgi:GntR family transcriptional regulator, transcriptional repressor for pyruvate dehydrogenase complex